MFSAQIVQPIYFVTFTSSVILASIILFQGLNTPGGVNTISLLCGFYAIALGVYLLNVSRTDPEGNGRSNENQQGTGAPRHSMFETGILNPRMSLSGHRFSNASDLSPHHEERLPLRSPPNHSQSNVRQNGIYSTSAQGSMLFDTYNEENNVGLSNGALSDGDEFESHKPGKTGLSR